jgi:hypothetical protein
MLVEGADDATPLDGDEEVHAEQQGARRKLHSGPPSMGYRACCLLRRHLGAKRPTPRSPEAHPACPAERAFKEERLQAIRPITDSAQARLRCLVARKKRPPVAVLGTKFHPSDPRSVLLSPRPGPHDVRAPERLEQAYIVLAHEYRAGFRGAEVFARTRQGPAEELLSQPTRPARHRAGRELEALLGRRENAPAAAAPETKRRRPSAHPAARNWCGEHLHVVSGAIVLERASAPAHQERLWVPCFQAGLRYSQGNRGRNNGEVHPLCLCRPANKSIGVPELGCVTTRSRWPLAP